MYFDACILLMIVAFYPLLGEQNTRELAAICSQIPKKDRKELEFFFQDMIFNNHFGYTLFGDKPISLGGYFSIPPKENVMLGAKPSSTHKRWKTWKRYRHLFPIKNYLLLEEENPNDPNNRIITLINKRAFLDKVEKNLDLFREVLGKKITGEALLQEASKKETHLFRLLKKDESLYGILLGYGKSNALLFKRYIALVRASWYKRGNYTPKVLKPSKGYNSIGEELLSLKKSLEIVPYPDERTLEHVIYRVIPVHFLSIKENPETASLRKKYKKQKKMITLLCSKKNVLEVVLQKLCECP